MTHNPPKIFITRDIPEIGIEMLKAKGFELTVWTDEQYISQADLITKLQDYDVLLSNSADKIDAHFLEKCRHLDLISQFAVGYDNFDIEAATRLGIPIANTPNAMSNATADVAFGLMINVAKKMFYMHNTIAKGEWKYFVPKRNLGFELKNKTLGIFGLGRIGMEMAKRCQGAYDMPVIYCNRTANPEAEARFKARKVSFEVLLQQSDVITVHAALTAETREIFNQKAFALMKPSAIFINTARGGLHNEADLLAALQQGEIWGAGLDVTNPEPMRVDNPLLFMPNVAILPHIGSSTMEARNEMSRLAAMNIIEYYEGKPLTNLVNTKVLDKR
jgi:glyoxylate reductase